MITIAELFPDLNDGSDITDFFVRDAHTRADFDALLEAATPYAPEAVPPTVQRYPGFSDSANSDLFLSEYGTGVLYVTGRGWHLDIGTHFERDESDLVPHMAKRIADRVRAIAEDAPEGPERDKLRQDARRLESRSAMLNMLATAANDPRVRVSSNALDSDPYLFNCVNGTLDARTGELRPHSPTDRLSKCSPIAYDPDATAPRWEAFLTEMFAGNTDTIAFLQRYAGSMLTGDTRDQKLVLLHGVGANGKSVFLDVMRHILGAYSAITPFDSFAVQRNVNGARNDLARLAGVRCVIASEAGENVKLDEAMIKSITGGEKIAARFLFGEFFEFKPQFKIFLSANHRPRITGTDYGIWRRVCLVPCSVVIPPERQDQRLAEKLRAEAPGILAWLVRGCMAWQRDGLNVPPQVQAATAEYREESDVIGAFIADRCDEGDSYSVAALDAYRAYAAWATERGQRPVTSTTFGRQLGDRGIGTRRSNGVRRVGIRLKDAPAQYATTAWTPDDDVEAPAW